MTPLRYGKKPAEPTELAIGDEAQHLSDLSSPAPGSARRTGALRIRRTSEVSTSPSQPMAVSGAHTASEVHFNTCGGRSSHPEDQAEQHRASR